MKKKNRAAAAAWTILFGAGCLLAMPAARAAEPATLSIDLTKSGPAVPSTLYGLMTEEINHSYDGGLYAELIRNRNFLDDANVPSHWALVQTGTAAGSLSLDKDQPLSTALPVSLRLDITKAGGTKAGGTKAGGRVGVTNEGYWGVPVKPSTSYRASFYARAAPGFSGPLTLSLESADGSQTYAQARQSGLTADWKQYTVTLKTKSVSPSLGRFVVATDRPGTVWLSLVSLFPPTFNNRPNGTRIDLMQKMAAMKPSFLRLPGGNYLEGNTIATRFDWKKTIGPLKDRPGHPAPWGYRSTDGMGLTEFLEWCEDLKMQPLLGLYAGYSLGGEFVNAGPELQPYVQDALDEIEYVMGGTDTKWGAERAKNGHPKPFPMTYVEVGNEDGFDKSGTYEARFTQFYDAIKAKYPDIKIISSTGGKDSVGRKYPIKTRTPDAFDEHYYQSAEQMQRDAHRYDSYDRQAPKVFVGEWAAFDKIAPWEQKARDSGPTSSFVSALGDAAWMTGLERNCDVVALEAYAPLFVNVNPDARQWAINLIGYDALSSFAAPSYYVQTMFGQNHGDVVVPATLTGTQLFESVTRDTKTGRLYLKLVNTAETAQSIHITLNGVRAVSATGTALTLSSRDLAAINTLAAPTKVVPVGSYVPGISRDFIYTAAPSSVTVLAIQTGK